MIFGTDVVDVRVEYPPPAAAKTSHGLEARRRLSNKTHSGPSSCIPIDTVPDPRFGDSWGLEQANDIDVDATGAWSVCSGDGLLPVGVFDDGVEMGHPDLPNVVPGVDVTDECLSPPCIGQPQSVCDNHGTAVAGVLGAASSDVGSLGMAPNVQIVPIRIGRYTLINGGFCLPVWQTEWVVNGVLEAVTLGVAVTNMSWNFGSNPIPEIEKAYQVAFRAGIVHFTSAGNRNDTKVHVPGDIFEVNSISGIDSDGNRMFITSTFGSNIGSAVAVTGPAQIVFTTDRTGGLGYEDALGPFGDNYVSLSGTSFASPHAAGVGALCHIINPGIAPEGIGFVLRASAVDLGDPGRDDIYGDGLVNAEAALNLAPDVISVFSFETGNLLGWSEVVTQ